MADSPAKPPSAILAAVGNALSQAARPVLLLLAGIGYGPIVVGHLAAALSLVVLGTVALYPALGYSVLRHRGDFTLSTGLIRRMGLTLLGGTAILGVVVLIDAATLGWTSRVLAMPGWTLWVVILTPLTVAEQYALGLCSAAGVLDRYSLAMLASRLVLLAGSVGLILMRSDPTWFLALVAITSMLFLLQAARALGRPSPGRSPKGLVRDGLAAAPNAWAWFLMAQAPILVVRGLMGPQEAGLFTIALLLLNMPLLLIAGISLTWTAMASRQGPTSEWQRTRQMVPRLVLAHLAIVFLVAAMGGQVWVLAFGPDLVPAFELLRWMAFGAIGFAMAYLLMPQLLARGWFAWLSAMSMVSALLYLGSVFAAARAGSLVLVAACTSGLGIALALTNGWAAWRWNRVPSAARHTEDGGF